MRKRGENDATEQCNIGELPPSPYHHHHRKPPTPLFFFFFFFFEEREVGAMSVAPLVFLLSFNSSSLRLPFHTPPSHPHPTSSHHPIFSFTFVSFPFTRGETTCSKISHLHNLQRTPRRRDLTFIVRSLRVRFT